MRDVRYVSRGDTGWIASELQGPDSGPLVVLSPGLGDTRATYRFLVPLLVDAGYRVATVDLRGHGESSTGWASYSRSDTADDLAAVIESLDEPAVLVGQSFSGGSATIAAATRPDLVRAIIEIGPFTRPPSFSLGALIRNDHAYRKGALLLARFAISGSVRTWAKYLDVAYPGVKPADWDEWLPALLDNLREPGRMAAARAMLQSRPTDAAASLAEVRCPALIIMGTDDSDFADPPAEAAGIVEAMPPGVGRIAMIDGAGHYPHAQYPEQTADAAIAFLQNALHA